VEAVIMTEAKTYEVEGLTFEFSPNGSPLTGVLAVTEVDLGTYTAEVSLEKGSSRRSYAKEASELYSFDVDRLKRALNEICTLRTDEVRRAAESEDVHEVHQEPETLSHEADALVSSPGVLSRYVEDVARIRGVVGDREPLRLQTLVAFGAQLAPLPSGRPAGANLILTAEAGRGKNYICDAVTTALPEEFTSLSSARAQRASSIGEKAIRQSLNTAFSTQTKPKGWTSLWNLRGRSSPAARHLT
jgi:hypothetical protein